jgi:zinc/manganese transport system permease protein
MTGGGPSWNLASDLDQLLSYHFMVNALEAGTIVAVMAGVIGWFMVVRRQTFAGHTLSVIAFPGAAAAALAGLPLAVGYFTFCGGGALILAAVGGSSGARRHSSESASIGSLQAFALALGFLFLSLYRGALGSVESQLFGAFVGIDDNQVLVLLIAAAVALALIAAAARPLLFASIDPEVARAAGVPVPAVAVGFLFLLGLGVAATSQITGALLVFALLVTPGATAQLLTARPALGLGLAVLIALTVTWVGLGIAYFSPYPVGFWVTSLSFGLYVLARIAVAPMTVRRRRTHREVVADA